MNKIPTFLNKPYLIQNADRVLAEVKTAIGQHHLTVITDGFRWIAETARAQRHQGCRFFVLDKAVTKLIVEGMQIRTPIYSMQAVLMAGCRSLTDLAQFGNDAVRVQMVKDGCVPVIIKAVEEYPISLDRDYSAIYYLFEADENIPALRDTPGLERALRRVIRKGPRNSHGAECCHKMLGVLFPSPGSISRPCPPPAPAAVPPGPPSRRSAAQIGADLDAVRARAEELKKEMRDAVGMEL